MSRPFTTVTKFAQVTERLSVGDAVATFHHGGVTGAEAEHETPWSQLRNVGGLLRHYKGMPRKGWHDGGAHSHQFACSPPRQRIPSMHRDPLRW